jgi:hypothetical protein
MRTGTFFALGLVAAAGCAAAAGCSSKSSSSSGQSQDQIDLQAAHDYYVSHVHPAVTNCVGCHAPGGAGPAFMDTDAETSYQDLASSVGLIAAPKNSPLIQYVHMDKTIVESPEQRNVIAVWLGLEANARHLDGAVPKPATITDAYKQFADCMNFEVWEYYRMGDLPFTETDSEGPCLGCHTTGQGSAFLSADSRSTFDNTKTFPYIQKLVVGQLDDKGNFLALVPSNRFIDKADEGCPNQDPTTCHPRYGLPPIVIGDIQGFVSTTLQDLATDTCGSNIVVPQAEAGPVDAGGG